MSDNDGLNILANVAAAAREEPPSTTTSQPHANVVSGPPAAPATVEAVFGAMATCAMNSLRTCRDYIVSIGATLPLIQEAALPLMQNIVAGYKSALQMDKRIVTGAYQAFLTATGMYENITEESLEQQQRRLERLFYLYIQSQTPDDLLTATPEELTILLQNAMSVGRVGDQKSPAEQMIDQLIRFYFLRRSGIPVIHRVFTEGVDASADSYAINVERGIAISAYAEEIEERLRNFDYESFFINFVKNMQEDIDVDPTKRGNDSDYYGSTMSGSDFMKEEISKLMRSLTGLNKRIQYYKKIPNKSLRSLEIYRTLVNDNYNKYKNTVNDILRSDYNKDKSLDEYMLLINTPGNIRDFDSESVYPKLQAQVKYIKLYNATLNILDSITPNSSDREREREERGGKRKTRKHSKNHNKSKKSRRVKGVKRSTKKR